MTPLYHWAPAFCRPGILQHGLIPASERPGDQPTTCKGRMEYVCLSPDPRVGWKLSAGMDWTPTGEWDLWVTDLPDYVYELRLRVEDGEVLEVKVHGNIRAEHLWLAGMRIA